jgi:hypothetical protein
MVRKLSQAEVDAAAALLQSAPQLNLYMLGNLATLGLESDLCEFWGDFYAGRLRAVLNRYMQGWSIFGRQDADWPALGRVVDSHPQGAARLQDNPGGVASFLPFLVRYTAGKVTVAQVMELAPEQFRPSAPRPDVRIRRATLDDLPALTDFYRDAGDMRRTAASVRRPLEDTRVWVAEQARKIVSAALTNAETDTYAMVGGVYTPPAQRNRGLSQMVCSALCEDILASGRLPVLYWQEPAAGTVYRKLGFRPRGSWRSVWLTEVSR